VAKLISKVEPEYPWLAKANHIQGVVRLTLVLYNDGRVMHVLLVSGHPLLVQEAEDAVKQWMYSPTLVNGTPVEVVTEVEVEFFLPN
jgi:periplasmic protein TonB